MPHGAFAADVPFGGKLGEVDLYAPPEIERRLQQFLHKLLNVLWTDPCSAQPHFDLRSVQILGLCAAQRFEVGKDALPFFHRQEVSNDLRIAEFFTNIAGEIFICCDITKTVQVEGYGREFFGRDTAHIEKDNSL